MTSGSWIIDDAAPGCVDINDSCKFDIFRNARQKWILDRSRIRVNLSWRQYTADLSIDDQASTSMIRDSRVTTRDHQR